MVYNSTVIKEFTNHRVRLKYSTNGIPRNLSGFIVYIFDKEIIFRLTDKIDEADSIRVSIKYNNIEFIEKIKSYEEYITRYTLYFKLQEFQKAFDIAFKLLEFEMFRLPEQIKALNQMIRDCKKGLFAGIGKQQKVKEIIKK